MTYLERARDILRSSTSIESFASACRVKESTAWSYTYQILNEWRDIQDVMHVEDHFLFRGLDGALERVDTRGSLHDVATRLQDGPFRGATEWRAVKDHYAHVRVARLCNEIKRA